MQKGILEALRTELGNAFGVPLLTSTLSASAFLGANSKARAYGSVSHAADEGVMMKYESCPYCPRIRHFREIFSSHTISLLVTKNVVLSLAVEFAPHVTEVCQELQDADEEDREPELPERPPLGPALIRGMIGSLRQATVLFVRWLYDQQVHAKLPGKIAFRLLKDYRREIRQTLALSSRLRWILPVYTISMEANHTWLLADLTVAICFITIRMRNIKDHSRWNEYWFLNIGFQMIKNSLQMFVSPVGAVLGALITGRVAGTIIGYNMAELALNASVDYAAVTYSRR